MSMFAEETKMMGMFGDGAADSHSHITHISSPRSPYDSDLTSPMTMAADENVRLPNGRYVYPSASRSHSHHHSSTTTVAHHAPYNPHYQHRGSTSTTHSTSESTDSSPTTTISTADSVSITDPSPNSSPESLVTIVPLSSFTSKSTLGGHHHMSDDLMMSPPLSPLPSYHQPLSPGKKARNMKNLSLNMAAPHRPAPRPPLQVKTASMLDTSTAQSAPPSPTFAFPMKPPMKKRPSKLGLSIQTSATNPLPDTTSRGLRIVPPTPSRNVAHLTANTLRHHQSSPSLSLFSPTSGVQGGMQLPSFTSQTAFQRPRQITCLSRHSSVDSNSTASGHASPDSSTRLSELEEEDDDYDPPLSQEIKSPAYPAGPVCIYDPLVYLYLEPSLDEALQFDVVFNVAREVKNPFSAPSDAHHPTVTATVKAHDATPVTQSMSTTAGEPQEPRDVDMTEAGPALLQPTARPAPEDLADAEATSPTTPKAATAAAAAAAAGARPEYVHMQWDHNTSIVDDLFHLVETIDERVRQGKRVLIHCQCGVSRSASLIVAYGLYKSPSLTVQEAYDAVKQRSRWIGPNMSLIYQLSEFRTKLLQKTGIPHPGHRHWRNGGSTKGSRSNTIPTSSPIKRPSLTGETFEAPPPRTIEPLTAPLPEERARMSGQPRVDQAQDDTHLHPNVPAPMTGLDALGAVTPGPSSAPPGISWLSDAMMSGRPVTSAGSAWPPSVAPTPQPEHTTFARQPTTQPSSPSLPLLFPSSLLAKKRSRHQLHLGTRIDPPTSLALSLQPSLPTHQTAYSPLSLASDAPPAPTLLSPRAIEFTANPFRTAPMPPVPTLPTTTSFTATPIPAFTAAPVSSFRRGPVPRVEPEAHAAAASSFGFSTSGFDSLMSPTSAPAMTLPPVHPSPAPSHHATQTTSIQGGLVDDPRSPVQRGEAPIVRSIFDVL